MKATSIIQIVIGLLAATSSIVAMAINKRMISSIGDAQYSTTSPISSHLAAPSEVNMEVENILKKRIDPTGLFVTSAVLGVFSFVKDTVRGLIGSQERKPGSNIIIQLAHQPPWDAEDQDPQRKNPNHQDDTNGRMPGA